MEQNQKRSQIYDRNPGRDPSNILVILKNPMQNPRKSIVDPQDFLRSSQDPPRSARARQERAAAEAVERQAPIGSTATGALGTTKEVLGTTKEVLGNSQEILRITKNYQDYQDFTRKYQEILIGD